MYCLSESMGLGVRKPSGESKRGAAKARLYRLHGFLRSWRQKTKGCRIECQRHHLKNDVLSQFGASEVQAAIALVIGRPDGGRGAYEAGNTVTSREPLDVIFEYPAFEECMGNALDRRYGKPKITGVKATPPEKFQATEDAAI